MNPTGPHRGSEARVYPALLYNDTLPDTTTRTISTQTESVHRWGDRRAASVSGAPARPKRKKRRVPSASRRGHIVNVDTRGSGRGRFVRRGRAKAHKGPRRWRSPSGGIERWGARGSRRSPTLPRGHARGGGGGIATGARRRVGPAGPRPGPGRGTEDRVGGWPG